MKAYAYFDIDGKLKEFIIDPSVRQGNENVNEIMLYMENDWNGLITGDSVADDNHLAALFGVYTTTSLESLQQFPDVSVPDFFYHEQIPAKKNYDPRYFKYGEYYNFIKVVIPSEVTDLSGNAYMTVAIYNLSDEVIRNLDLVTFAIEETLMKRSPQLDWSEYLYIMNTVADIENKINHSGSTTIGNMQWKDTLENIRFEYNLGAFSFNCETFDINELTIYQNSNDDTLFETITGDLHLTPSGKLIVSPATVATAIFEEDVTDIKTQTTKIGTLRFTDTGNSEILETGVYPIEFDSKNFTLNANGRADFINSGFSQFTINPGNGEVELSTYEDLSIWSSEDINIESNASDVSIKANNDIDIRAQRVTVAGETDDVIISASNKVDVTGSSFTWNNKNVATENYVDGEIDIIEGLIPSGTTTGNKLVNASQLSQAIAEFAENEFQAVDTTEYPTLDDFLASTGEAGIIYLYPTGTGEYYRYIWEDSAWVSLGITTLDLTGYAQLGVSQTWTAQQQFNARVIFTSDTNLYNTRITTNSKSYFARVGVTSNQYITYNLPFNYSDVGSQATYTLETQEHAAASYVAKSNISSALYATGGGVVLFGMGASANRIVQRDNDGQVNVPLIPTNAAHAVSKSFIDSAFTEITIEED